MNHPEENKIKGLTVLYVEDEVMLSEEVSAYLKRRVGKLFSVHDGVEALEILEHYPVDVVITDLLMPKMDGMKLTQMIREKHQSLPVIITTAINDVSVMQHSIEHGINRYIIKPFDPSELIEALVAVSAKIERRVDGSAVSIGDYAKVTSKIESEVAKLIKNTSGKGPDKVSAFLQANLMELVIKGSRTKLEQTIFSNSENIRVVDFLRETYYKMLTKELCEIIKEHSARHAHLLQVVSRSGEDIDIIKFALD
ncbi:MULTISPECIES: Na-translocating system protein MpsC family protein [unclassified Fusibacter]|uniref:Na-translocating system protein MpsC family protein n=1 Tax=unclassified Fusibacter TaxID=2624464 RepID=UPI001013C0B5|nr:MULTISPECIES: Na-translocating system protein MpsC family protein [unclassified Fusibacter]MCK8058603.1 Na-translocating system protein MpsC family protein [Fusibacter sp. A2]NPE22627.1 response regulator [Fusibacter sp. A1]RXV60191.1 response regulator [Fusibacter sp. A1]